MAGCRSRWGWGVALVLVFSAACARPAPPPASTTALADAEVTVASFDFPESALLAELYGQALEASGHRVRRALSLGPREFVQPALARGLVEFVPEYAGTALRFLEPGAPAADPQATHAALVHALAGSRVVALAPAPAQDVNTFVVTRSTASRLGLTDLTDLAGVAGGLTFGGPPECDVRPLCLLGLRQVYDVSFREVVPLDAGGPLTRTALADGYVDVALLFSTDPVLATEDIVELADVRHLQPAEQVTPLVRAEVVSRWPGLVERVNQVSALLTTQELRALNAEVASGVTSAAAASAWLSAKGLR